jgi:hypothetical protein
MPDNGRMPNDEIARLVNTAVGNGRRAEAGGNGGGTGDGPHGDGPHGDDAHGDNAAGRRQALAALVPVLGRSAKSAGIGAVAAGRWLVELIIDLAPHVPVRDAATLRKHFPGLSDPEIAERLVKAATKATTSLGAAAGGLAAVEFISPPLLLAAPAQLAAEVLTVTAVELKLVAELHEILGRPARGSASDRAGAYLMSWVRRRAVSETVGSTGLGAVVGVAAKRELRSQVLRRLGRSATTLAPFLAGAVAGGEVNRRATRALGEALLAELVGQRSQRRSDRWFRPA